MARKPGLGKGLGALIPENETPSDGATATAQAEGPLRRYRFNQFALIPTSLARRSTTTVS